MHRLAKSVTDTASIRSFDSFSSGTRSDANTNTYFAFHRSVPGQLVLTSTAIRFVPAKRLRKLGFQKLVARAAKKWDPSIELDESYYHDGDQDSLRDSDASEDRENEVEMLLRMGEIEKVKKEKHYRLPALSISNNRGEVSQTLSTNSRTSLTPLTRRYGSSPTCHGEMMSSTSSSRSRPLLARHRNPLCTGAPSALAVSIRCSFKGFLRRRGTLSAGESESGPTRGAVPGRNLSDRLPRRDRGPSRPPRYRSSQLRV